MKKKVSKNFVISNNFCTFAAEMNEGTRKWFPPFVEY